MINNSTVLSLVRIPANFLQRPRRKHVVKMNPSARSSQGAEAYVEMEKQGNLFDLPAMKAKRRKAK